MYTDNYDGWIVPGVVNRTFWYQQLARKTPTTTSAGDLRWPESFTCPAETVPVGQEGETGKYQYTHYGSNTYLTGAYNGLGAIMWADQYGHKLASVRKPSRAIFICDSGKQNEYKMIYTAYLAFRHDAGVNVLYADGHVKTWKYGEFNSGPNKLKIGFDYPGYENY